MGWYPGKPGRCLGGCKALKLILEQPERLECFGRIVRKRSKRHPEGWEGSVAQRTTINYGHKNFLCFSLEGQEIAEGTDNWVMLTNY